MSNNKTYIAIDLKSFYASVECRERALDPLKTNLVVADASRTSKTICLAVSPSLKKYGISGRARLFEVEQKAKEIKRQTGKDLEYITAVPRMALYIKYSAEIYSIYLRFFSSEDIHVYSIDEVFIDVTGYLSLYKMTAKELTQKVIKEVLQQTGITATAGIAPNLYLAKIAMDIVAKHVEPDENGVRIAELDEMTYRKTLWNHQPLTDFWRIGPGIQNRLHKNVMFTMGDIARRSLTNKESLYKTFGIDAEILIDHAWGYEPCSIKDIKAYKSDTKSLGSGQVLHEPYDTEKAAIIVREMTELLALDMFEKSLASSSYTLMIGYERIDDESDVKDYNGDFSVDRYGRVVPKPENATCNTGIVTNSSQIITQAVMELYYKIVNTNLMIRRINISANNLVDDNKRQLNLFEKSIDNIKEDNIQQTRLEIMKRFGKNALLKGTDLQKGATTIDRNNQIGGHKA